MTARVTVAIPTWNRAELLRSCISSVLEQTLQDFELIVIDNASTDETPDVVAAFGDSRIRYVRNPENIGGQPNLNKALHSGSAPYVVLLFDDDYLLPNCLERKAAVLDRHGDVVVVHSAFEMRSADGALLKSQANFAHLSASVIETSREFIELSMRKQCRIHISSAMVRRSGIADEGFRPEDLPADDHGLWLRVAARGSVAYLHETLDGMHMVPGRAVGNGMLMLDDGRFKPTLRWAASAKKAMTSFLSEYDAPAHELRRLRKLARKGSKVSTVQVLRNSVPGFRPVGEAARLFIEAVKVEPAILLEPRLAKLFLGR